VSLMDEYIFKPIGDAIDGIAWLDGVATHAVVNLAVGATRTRPHPWSTCAPYITWEGLSDRNFLGRHLPPSKLDNLPDWTEVQRLFARPVGQQRLSPKSTCLFPAFAQYLTDGFIRTVPTDPRRTTTNHDIDLCPLYGLNRTQTDALRAKDGTRGRRGRLKTQEINGEDFAPYLFEGDRHTIKPEFAQLDLPLLMHGQTTPPQQPWPPAGVAVETLFAFGGDRVNATPFTAMLNTLLLREHNRLAAGLEALNPLWCDERVFQTARNINIVMFIKLVVEEYINHIMPLPFSIGADPTVAWTANWNRPNRITAEFSLLYRWHSLMPDTIKWDGMPPIDIGAFQLDNTPLVQVGLNNAFEIAASQAAGHLGAFNTSEALLPIEKFAVKQARSNQLASYNDYRVAFGMKPAKEFRDISGNLDVANLLRDLYDTPDRVEFYPGLFAEDTVHNGILPGLLMAMVAVDAFSQALTNPLLSEHVWTKAPAGNNWPDAFTDWGREEIARTHKLKDILERNVKQRGNRLVEMTARDGATVLEFSTLSRLTGGIMDAVNEGQTLVRARPA
jgi:prostaglandin-endoperoxide synthase 2